MKSFEVQIRRSGHWHTDSTYDDRELAELRARQVDSSSRSDPVRVVEEAFQERTQKYVLRTIFRSKETPEADQVKGDDSLRAGTDTAVLDRPSEMKKPGNPKEPEKPKGPDRKKDPEKEKGPENASGQSRAAPPVKRKSLGAGALFGILVLIIGLGIAAMIALEYLLNQA